MPATDANQYFAAITHLEAEELLLKLRIADFPYNKKDAREKFHKQMSKLAERKQTKGKPLTMEMIFATLKGGLNGR